MGVSPSSCTTIRANSTENRSIYAKNDDDAIFKIMMPVYYLPDVLRKEEVDHAKRSWSQITNGHTPVYILAKSSGRMEHENCEQWFAATLYGRLFDIHPVRLLFYSIVCILILSFLSLLFFFALRIVPNDSGPSKLSC